MNYSAISNRFEVWQGCLDQGFTIHDLTEEEATMIKLMFPYAHLYPLSKEQEDGNKNL